MKKLILTSLFLFLFFGVNFAFADKSELDSDFEIYQHPYIQLRIPELQIYEDSFNENEIDFKIDFIDLRKPDKGGEFHGLGQYYETYIKPKDVDKHDLDNRRINSILKDYTGNIINSTNYKLISTGENKFETDGKVKDQVYIQWYKDEGLWEKYSDAEKKSLMYNQHIQRKEIIPVEPIDTKDFHHKLNNKAIFPDVRYTLEGKIQYDSFIPGKTYTFEVYSSSLSGDSIKFEIPKKENIPEKQEEILTYENNEQRSEQFLTDMEEQQILQQEQALKEHEEKKRQQELDDEEPIIEPKKTISETPIQEEPIPEPILEYTPEPVMDPEPTDPNCGQGTVKVDGFCQVKQKESSFLDLLLKFFSNLF